MKLCTSLLLLIATLFCHNTYAQDTAAQRQIMLGLEDMYRTTAPATTAKQYQQEVPVGQGARSIRGFTTGRNCLFFATVFAMYGEDSSAIQWLMVGIDGDKKLKKKIVSETNFCINLLRVKYGKDALKAFGFTTYGNVSQDHIKAAYKDIIRHQPDRKGGPKE